ncbi:uncharacterized protein L3040_007747 [Drepanopeziza brunnea f. sp. 'multigermtubi']|uniref:uncharacterized protein n=1 Tax=Drepanopeziza brunnea f. sp. 'multigermtubi' TaxID=698441 RepID=UPI002398554F|nr:hypothetical protein L3040_007747 [Drepanopeziza brunnea f. sp. 'multigermtubi']
MQLTALLLTAAVALGCAPPLELEFPERNGDIISLDEPQTIEGEVDMNYKEYDRGRPCNTDEDLKSNEAVFILEDGAILSNVIIGSDQLEGIHCKGACTLINVWFRDVCEDAVSMLGKGDVFVEGGGANAAIDKVFQHNGRGTVTIKDFTITNAGTVYRGCGNCTNNGGPRSVIFIGLRAHNVTDALAGINVNYGDTATIFDSCGSDINNICQEWKGVNKSEGIPSARLDSKGSCLGEQGKLDELPTC